MASSHFRVPDLDAVAPRRLCCQQRLVGAAHGFLDSDVPAELGNTAVLSIVILREADEELPEFLFVHLDFFVTHL